MQYQIYDIMNDTSKWTYAQINDRYNYLRKQFKDTQDYSLRTEMYQLQTVLAKVGNVTARQIKEQEILSKVIYGVFILSFLGLIATYIFLK